jgi:hypothetical protein
MSRETAATKSNCYPLFTTIGGSKQKTPEQWTFWTFCSGVRGRS